MRNTKTVSSAKISIAPNGNEAALVEGKKVAIYSTKTGAITKRFASESAILFFLWASRSAATSGKKRRRKSQSLAPADGKQVFLVAEQNKLTVIEEDKEDGLKLEKAVVSMSSPAVNDVYLLHSDSSCTLVSLGSLEVVGSISLASKGVDFVVAYPTPATALLFLGTASSSIEAYSFKLVDVQNSKVTPSVVATSPAHPSPAQTRLFSQTNSQVCIVTYSPPDRSVLIHGFDIKTNKLSTQARWMLDSSVEGVSVFGKYISAIDSEGVVAIAEVSELSNKLRDINTGSQIFGGISQACLLDEQILVARGTIKLSFETIAFLSKGAFVPTVQLAPLASLLQVNASSTDGSKTSRYSESSAAVRNVMSVEKEGVESTEKQANDGELDIDVELAEVALIDRLKGKSKSKAYKSVEDETEEDGVSGTESDSDDSELEESNMQIPTTSLAATLIQSLHTQDPQLLSHILRQTNPTLIRQTVSRLPSGSVVIKFVGVLMERLTGQSGKKGKALGGTRGIGLLTWVREVLVQHAAFLVTIPSLTTQLSSLHKSLSSHLMTHQTLLALDGRLDLILSQLEVKRSIQAVSTQEAPSRKQKNKKPKAVPTKYVEGESDGEGEVELIALESGDEILELSDVEPSDDSEDEEFEGIVLDEQANSELDSESENESDEEALADDSD